MIHDFDEQKKTLKDAKRLLSEYHKAVIIRPTGFGKTWMLTELIKKYKSVLYIYPSAVIRDTVVNRYYGSMFDENEQRYIDENGDEIDPETVDTCIAMNQIDNCVLMTYAKLINLTNEDFEEMSYDLVIFDECHRMGGHKTKIAVEKLFAKLGKISNFIGATATPTRMDNFDVVSHFFADHMTYTYTLHNAIEDNIVKKPNYCYATYDFETDLKNAALTAGENPNDPLVSEIINAKVIELAKIYNMPSIIKEVCDKYAANTSYMKFICFFASKQHMTEKLNDVKSWFQDAYPDHTVSVLKISSCNHTELQNVSKLNELMPKENHIDIIACIDMLNLGYHVNNQTGIFMCRGTNSSTVFIQQLGRALSVGSDCSAIVFDIVDNLHRKAVFELGKSVKRTKHSHNERKRIPTHYFLSNTDNATLVFYDDDKNIITSQYHLDEHNNIVDENNMPSTLCYDDETGEIYNTSSSDDERKNINTITAECLHAVGHEATYREIIAKAMAEPMTQRCKSALELHFSTWCYQHNIEYPISKEKLKKMYNLNKEDFYNEFCNLLKQNKINYPLQDVNALLAIGEDDTNDVPLRICAKARNVSVAQILDMLSLKER